MLVIVAFLGATTIRYIMQQRAFDKPRVIAPETVAMLGENPEYLARCAGFFAYHYSISKRRMDRQFALLLASAALAPPTSPDKHMALFGIIEEEKQSRVDRMGRSVKMMMSNEVDAGLQTLVSNPEAQESCVETAVKLRDLVRKS